MYKRTNGGYRTLALLLAAAMAVTALPQTALTVSAAEQTEIAATEQEQPEPAVGEEEQETPNPATEDGEAQPSSTPEESEAETEQGASEEEVQKEEAVPAEQTVQEPLEETDDRTVDGVVDTTIDADFQNLQVDFYKDTIKIVNGFFICGQGTGLSIRVREYDKDGNLLNVQEMLTDKNLNYSKSRGGYELSNRMNEGYGYSVIPSISILEDTATIQLVAYIDQGVSGMEEKTVQSGEMKRDDYPTVTVCAAEDEWLVTDSVAVLNFSYESDAKLMGRAENWPQVNAVLEYGTSKTFEADSTETYELNQISDGNMCARLTGLTAGTTYYCRLRYENQIYVYTEQDGSLEKTEDKANICSAQTDTLQFTTLENADSQKKINVEQSFPDEALREAVKDAVSGELAEDRTVTEDQLAAVEELDQPASGIKDTTGLELLPCLRNLNLTDNELTTFPDLSKNRYLTSVNLDKNRIPAEQFSDGTIPNRTVKDAAWLTAQWIEDTRKSQKTEGIAYTFEPVYYGKEGSYPFFLVAEGDVDAVDTFYVMVDDTEYSLATSSGEIWGRDDGFRQVMLPLAMTGSNEKTVAVYTKDEDGQEQNRKEVTVTFSDADYVGNTTRSSNIIIYPIHYSAGNGKEYCGDMALYLDLPEQEGLTIDHAELVDQDGRVFAESSECVVSENVSTIMKHLYSRIQGVSIPQDFAQLRRVELYMTANAYYGNDSYDLKVYYANESGVVEDATVTVKDAIVFTDQMVIKSAYVSDNQDSSGDYIYVNLFGDNINTEGLKFLFSYRGKTYETKQISAMPRDENNMTVKLQKIDWEIPSDVSMTLQIMDEQGTELFQTEYITNYSKIYYTTYNMDKQRFEIGVTGDLFPSGSKVSLVTVREGSNQYGIGRSEIVKTQKDVPVEDGWIYISMPKESLKSAHTYYMVLRAGGSDYSYEYTYYNLTPSTGKYRSISISESEKEKIIRKGTEVTSIYMNAYANDGKMPVPASVDVVDAAGNVVAGSISITKTSGSKSSGYQNSTYKALLNTKDLDVGTYMLVARNSQKQEIARSTDSGLRVLAADDDRMIIRSIPANFYWNTLTELYASISVGNVKPTDQIKAQVLYADGTPVEEEKVRVGSWIKTDGNGQVSVYMTYDGANPYKEFYVTLTDASKADEKAYTPAGEEYFSGKGAAIGVSVGYGGYVPNSKGEIYQITPSKLTVYPAKLYFFNPQDLTVYKEIELTDQNVTSYGYYTFTEDDVKDADGKKITAKCDAALIDAAHRMTKMFQNQNIGTRDSGTNSTYNTIQINVVENGREFQAGSIELNVSGDDSQRIKTVIGHVQNNSTPKFSVDNPKIVSLKVDSKDKKKAYLEAVAEGSAMLTVSVGELSEKIPITVTSEMEVRGLEVNHEQISLKYGGEGANQEQIPFGYELLSAKLYPAKAEYDEATIDCEVSENLTFEREEHGSGVENVEFCIKPTALGDGTGKVTLTATVTKNGEVKQYTATTDVTITQELTSEQKDAVCNAIDTDAMRAILMKGDKNAASVKLGAIPINVTGTEDVVAGTWSWQKPETVLKAEDSAPVKSYDAVFTPENSAYESFAASLPVPVTQVTGVTVTCLNGKTVSAGETARFQVNVNKIGADLPEALDGTTNPSLTVWTGEDQTPLTAENGVYCVDTAGKEGKLIVSAKLSGVVGDKTWEKPATSFCTVKKGIYQIKALGLYDVNDDKAVKSDDEVGLQAEAGKTTLAIDDTATTSTDRLYLKVTYYNADGTQTTSDMPGKTFSFKTSDRKVAEVQKDREGHSYILFKGAGLATITATAKDQGKASTQINVQVRSYTPVLTTNKITINTYLENPKAELPVIERNGAKITEASLSDADGKLTVTKDETNGKYSVELLTGYARKQTLKTDLTLKTDRGDEVTYPLSVIIDVTKPKATIKNTQKANLYEIDAAARYTVSANAEIESVEVTGIDSTFGYRGTYTTYNSQLYLTAFGKLTADNLSQYQNRKLSVNKGSAKIHFKGYAETADQTIPLTVATVFTPTKLKADNLNAALGQTSMTVTPYDSKTGKAIDLQGAKITNMSGPALSLDSSSGVLTVAATTLGTVKAKILLKYTTSPVDLTFKTGKMTSPELNLAQKAVTINTADTVIKSGYVEIPLTIKNSDQKPSEGSVTLSANGSAVTLLNSGYLEYEYEDGVLRLGVGSRPSNVRTGSYSLNVNCTDIYGEKIVKAAKLTVKIVESDVTAQVKTSGKINLLDRPNNGMLVTTILKNATSNVKVQGAAVTGEHADKFYAAYYHQGAVSDDGKFWIYAADDADVISGEKYLVKLRLVLSNDKVVETSTYVTATQKLPKLKVTAANAALYRDGTMSTTVQAASSVTDLYPGELSLVSNTASRYFTFDAETGTLSLKSADVPAGTYKLTMSYRVDGASVNVKGAEATLSITVR